MLIAHSASAANNIYLHYDASTTNAQVLNIFQQVGNAGGVNNRWIRSQLNQYPNGNGAWEPHNTSYGKISTLALETTKADFSYVNGTGDSGFWTDYTIGNIVGKRRDTGVGYVAYSSYATYTSSGNYDDMFLGVHNNSVVNGGIRIKINDVVSATGLDLDNGVYDEGAHGADNVNVAWIHIAANVRAGDVIKIEIKDDTSPLNRHAITGLRFYNNGGVPGDAGWAYFVSHLVIDPSSNQYLAISGGLSGQTHTFMWGRAHPNHEYNPNINIKVDGIPVILGINLVLNQVVVGNLVGVNETTTVYGNTKTTDDFGTLTRYMTWQDNRHTQYWRVDLTKDFNVDTAYASMWPSDLSTAKVFRYADIGNNYVTLLPNSGVNGGGSYVEAVNPSQQMIFYGGTANLKLGLVTTAPVTRTFINPHNTWQKGYFEVGSLEKQWTSGQSISAGTTTLTFDYQTPEQIAWADKTLVISQSVNISDAIESKPFNGNGLIVKTQVGASLAFDKVESNKTYFTSLNDDLLGTQDRLSTHNPAQGDWAGLTFISTKATGNVIKYATTGLTLSSNATAYNNSLYYNTTGMSATSGSIAKNNILKSNTTNTTGAGSFDYNSYLGNTEVNGLNTDPYLPYLAASDFSLGVTSSLIDSGTTTPNMTSTTTDFANHPIYGTPDIGAYEYQPPYQITTNHPEYTGNLRLYADGKYRYTTATSSTATANLSVTPVGGFPTYDASTSRPEYLNIASTTWSTTKSWVASSSYATTTIWTVGDLTPFTYYTLTVDGGTTTSVTCSHCQANDKGNIEFTYSGGWSTHTFALIPDTAAASITPATPNISTSHGGTSVANRVSNLLAMGNTQAAEELKKQYPDQFPAVAGQDSLSHGNDNAGADKIPNPSSVQDYGRTQQVGNDPSTSSGQAQARITRQLLLGTTNPQVKALQQFLNAHGFLVAKRGVDSTGSPRAGSPGHETTYFGQATKAALIKFQKANRINPIGVVGPATRTKIVKILEN